MSGSKGQTPSAADAGLLQMQSLLDTQSPAHSNASFGPGNDKSESQQAAGLPEG